MPSHEWKVSRALNSSQIDIYFEMDRYSAFPHLIRIQGEELLVSFREAPRVNGIQHTHPRSIITLIRSYDGGLTWDKKNTSQMGAGGGQELSLVSLGGEHVAGALAWHEVVQTNETIRTGIPQVYPAEFPFRTPGAFWAWSKTFGLTWLPHHSVFFGPGTMPCGSPLITSDGTLLCPVYGDQQAGMSSTLYRSLDQGRTWAEPTIIAQGTKGVCDYCEPCVVETSTHQYRAFHRVENTLEGQGCFWTNTSEDDGITWSIPQNTHILSGACPRILKLTDGRLLLTFGRRYPPFGIRAMLSHDGGETWGDTAWLLREANNWNQGYTSSIELGNNRILTVSYAENEDGITGIVGTLYDLP